MKAVLFSLLLAVIFAVAPTNTEDIRDRRQTQTQCAQMLRDNQASVLSTLSEVTSTCTTSCSSTCRSSLNSLKGDIGCCFESYGPTDSRNGLRTLLALCDIPPPGLCDIPQPELRNHASSVVITFSTIAIFSIIAYFVSVL